MNNADDYVEKYL